MPGKPPVGYKGIGLSYEEAVDRAIRQGAEAARRDNRRDAIRMISITLGLLGSIALLLWLLWFYGR